MCSALLNVNSIRFDSIRSDDVNDKTNTQAYTYTYIRSDGILCDIRTIGMKYDHALHQMLLLLIFLADNFFPNGLQFFDSIQLPNFILELRFKSKKYHRWHKSIFCCLQLRFFMAWIPNDVQKKIIDIEQWKQYRFKPNNEV